MKPADFRKIALSMPESAEGSHMGHADFRVKNKIFATLFSRDDVELGMVKLKPDQQRQFVSAHPDAFAPVKGGWGRGGATEVILKHAKAAAVKNAMMAAWINTAPKGLVESSGISGDD